jgi:hypothetical protein
MKSDVAVSFNASAVPDSTTRWQDFGSTLEWKMVIGGPSSWLSFGVMLQDSVLSLNGKANANFSWPPYAFFCQIWQTVRVRRDGILFQQ